MPSRPSPQCPHAHPHGALTPGAWQILARIILLADSEDQITACRRILAQGTLNNKVGATARTRVVTDMGRSMVAVRGRDRGRGREVRLWTWRTGAEGHRIGTEGHRMGGSIATGWGAYRILLMGAGWGVISALSRTYIPMGPGLPSPRRNLPLPSVAVYGRAFV